MRHAVERLLRSIGRGLIAYFGKNVFCANFQINRGRRPGSYDNDEKQRGVQKIHHLKTVIFFVSLLELSQTFRTKLVER